MLPRIGLWRFPSSKQLQKVFFFCHQWTDEERAAALVVVRESTGMLELMAAVRWADYFMKSCAHLRLLLETDSSSSAITL